jgi:hypothetical protein
MVISRMQSGLPVLASVGATAPFVGLLGTVIGIYNALIAIGVAGQASIDKVAGPVGEALIMTAIGLAVAVPAVLGLQRPPAPQQGGAGASQPLHPRVARVSDLGREDGSGHGEGPAPVGKAAAAPAR